MDFKGQPFVDDCEFPLQPFDNTFADIAERSDIVGIDGYLYWAHLQLLCNCACLPRLSSLTFGHYGYVHTIQFTCPLILPIL